MPVDGTMVQAYVDIDSVLSHPHSSLGPKANSVDLKVDLASKVTQK